MIGGVNMRKTQTYINKKKYWRDTCRLSNGGDSLPPPSRRGEGLQVSLPFSTVLDSPKFHV